MTIAISPLPPLRPFLCPPEKGVYANGFAEGAYPPPGPQACMRVGDILVSVDGKDVVGASLPTALAAIEAARRRVSGMEFSCLIRGEWPGVMNIRRRSTSLLFVL